jgi:hypothetical protein
MIFPGRIILIRKINRFYMIDKHLLYFNKMVSGFDDALKSSPDMLNVTHYAFAGFKVRMRCLGTKLALLHDKIFAHLKLKEMSPFNDLDLTIDIWDKSKTGISGPIDSISEKQVELRTVTSSADSRIVASRDSETSLFLDRKEKRIIASFASARRMNNYDLSKPFNKILALWYRDMNIEIIHASMISKEGKGILFLGKGGSGKTTAALSCLNAGFNYLGDDHVGLSWKDNSFTGHSLYASALIYANHLKRFPQLQKFEMKNNFNNDEKSIIYFSNGYLNKIDRYAEVTVLLLPKVGDSTHTNFRKAGKSETLLAIAPSSLRLQISPNQKGFDIISRLVDKIPAYWIELGSELDEIPDRVNEIIGL